MADSQRPEEPVSEGDVALEWGSDVVAEMLRRMDIEYITLNPGASFRGFHDSLVNYLGNRDPQILLCLHEDHSVAIAQGYAKASGKAMAVALHANVGLMHALLGIFNAWCDRMPMLLIGANGPFDTIRRRPWMDWLHTHKDQGALLRNSVKWDDEPRSSAALVESLLRAGKVMRTLPQGPVYVCVDGALQESRLPEPFELPSVRRYRAAPGPGPSPQEVDLIASALADSRRPLILMGRCSRSQSAWDQRVRLAELSAARVGTDLKSGAAFPTDHTLHLAGLTLRISEQVIDELRNADLVLLLDWIDTASLFKAAGPEMTARVINCSIDSYLHSGASMEHYGLAPADLDLLADPDALVSALLPALESRLNGEARWVASAARQPSTRAASAAKSEDAAIDINDIGFALDALRDDHQITLARVPIGWKGDCYPFTGPLDFLGYDGGGGLSSGPGNTIGAALALRGGPRRVVGILGDGDFMQACSALWTAARYSIPALFIIANNRSNYTDVGHQQTMARDRGRPLDNSGIGQHIEDPAIDIAALAKAQGVESEGPITRFGDLRSALEQAFAVLAQGRPCLLDVIVKRD